MVSKACLVGTYQRKLEEIAKFEDIDLTVVTPPTWRDERGTIQLERAHTEGYALYVEPIALNGHFHLHFYPTLGRVIKRVQPDIVHIDEEPYNLATWHALWLARRAGAKALFFTWQNIGRRYPPPFSWGERWVLHQADYGIAGTEGAAQVWRAKGYTGALAVIPQFGVDTGFFSPSSNAHKDKDEEIFTIGYAGRLVPEKGIDLLLNAAAELPAGHDWQIEILGSGPERAALQTLVGKLSIMDQVSFTAWAPSDQMPDFYRRIDVLVLPSRTRPNWKEQFGRVLIEAMACGTPVIGSNSGAIPEVTGGAGVIFPENDIDALRDALAELIEDRQTRRRLSEAGRTRAGAHFTHAQIATKTVQVYRKMA